MPKFNEISKKFNQEALFSSLEDVMNNKSVQDYILGVIQYRLLERGLDGNDKILQTDIGRETPSLYTYAPKTIRLKRAGKTIKNGKVVPSKQGVRPVKRVTLSQEGDFYKSFEIKTFFEGFEINADFQKEDGHIFQNFNLTANTKEEFEDLIMKLSDEQFELFLKKIKPFFMKKLKTKI